MRFLTLLAKFVLLGAFASPLPAEAQECQCSGKQIELYSGGDGKPLEWRFQVYLVSDGLGSQPKKLCYYKEVVDKSNVDARDVRWEVASYYRRLIKKGSLSSSCPEVEGGAKSTPTNGPLYFGPSSNGYDTTVIQPSTGWETSASNDGSNAGPGNITMTELAFDQETESGSIVTSRISFTTSFKSGKEAVINYSVENQSDTAYSVLVNLTANKMVLAKIPLIQRRLELPAHAKGSFVVADDAQVTSEPAEIVVYDTTGRISAIDSGSFYTFKGEKERSNRSFWDDIK